MSGEIERIAPNPPNLIQIIVSAVDQHEELVEALRHEIQRNHEHHAAGCSGCNQAEAALRKAVEGA
jgi:L-lactate utilization protein LutB